MPVARPRVIIADDNKTNQFLLELLLASAGFEPESVATGEEMLALLERSTNVHLVVIDFSMPSMNGVEAIKRVRLRELTQGLAHLPIIAVSASKENEVREACLAAGADAFFARPLPIDELVATASGCTAASQLCEDCGDENGIHQILEGAGTEPALSVAYFARTSARRDLVEAWTDDSLAAFAFMREAIRAHDPESFRKQVLSLASASSSVGGASIVDICDLFLEMAPAELIAVGETVLKTLEIEASRLRAALKDSNRLTYQSLPT